MNILKKIWKEEDINEFNKYLVSLKKSDSEKRTKKIVHSNKKIIGLNNKECIEIAKQIKKGKKNISYKDYLKLFLLTKGNFRTVCYRMMDIMQENIASKEPGFLMENCLFSYSWKGSLAAGGVKLNFVKQCSY